MATELNNFRAKYPQYNDINDIDLANMLAKKFPDAYGDLPGKYQQKPVVESDIDIENFLSKNQKTQPDMTRPMSVGAMSPEQVLPGGAEEGAEGISGIIEPAAMLATGSAAEIGSGYAAIRKLISSGNLAEAEKVAKDFQEKFTYTPKTESGKAAIQGLGKAVSVVSEPAGKAVKAAGQFSADVAGPTAGAITETTLRMIPEVLGLKINKAAKLKKINQVIDNDVSKLYDELGNIAPEIKKGLDDSGISIQDIEKNIPKQDELLKGAAEDIGEAAKAKTEAKPLKIAEEVRPDAEILKAAEELGVADGLLPSHVSTNPVYTALEQGLKSIPGSQLAATEKALISELGKKADDLITEFGGEIDKSLLSDKFRTETMNIIDSIGKKESELFDNLNKNIPVGFSVRAENTIKTLREKAKLLGGEKYLDKTEKLILRDLSPKSKPTYARLDKYRKLIGSAFKNKGPWKDADQGALKQMYKELAKDQTAFAEKYGYSDMYKSANNLTVQRKGLEDQLTKTLGKDLTGAISSKARNAMLALQKGDTKLFDDLGKTIPEQLGRESRRSVFVSALNDAFTQGSRKERSLNIPGFDDFMNGVNRNKAAKKRLTQEIGEEATKRLETLHKVVSGVRKAQENAITTGRVAAVPKMFDEVDNLSTKLYGLGKAASFTKSAVTGVLAAAIDAKKTPRSVAADELLSSKRFQDMVKMKAANRLETAEKIERANEVIERLKEYQKWKKTAPKKTLSDIASVGIIGYLTGENRGNTK